MRFRPRVRRMVGRGHVNAFIRRGEENPEFAVVKADGRRPGAAAVLHFDITRMRQVFDGVIDDRPVHQILRVQDRQSRRAIDTGSNQVKIVVKTNRIRVGIIRINYWVVKCSILLVGNPGMTERGCFFQ